MKTPRIKMTQFLLKVTILLGGIFVCNIFADEPAAIVGGTLAVDGEFPYHVAIKYGPGFVCGGSLISNQHVVTAAHCVSHIIPEIYHYISITTASVHRDVGGENHKIKDVRLHPQYNPSANYSYRHDIAVITLLKPLVPTKLQRPISIATVDPPPTIQPLTVTGWGKTSTDGLLSLELLKATSYTMTNQKCQTYTSRHIYDTHICAINPVGVGVCHGDSGGPLVYKNELVGIASWILQDSCGIGLPDVYTRVTRYRDFIQSVMNDI